MANDTSKYPDPFQMLDELYQKARAIMEQKNHDYRGGSGDPYANFRGSVNLQIHPIIGILLRIQDKMMRIQTFVEKGQLIVKGESVEDSLIDMMNYTALIKGLIEEIQAGPPGPTVPAMINFYEEYKGKEGQY